MPKRLPVKKVKRIGKHRYILKKFSKSNIKTRKKMMLAAPSQFFSIFKDICTLITEGFMTIGKAKRFEKLVTDVTKAPVSTIKGLISQRGGAIGSILAAVLPLLTPLLSKIFKK